MECIRRYLYRGAITADQLEAFCEAAQADAGGIRKEISDGHLLGLSLYTWEQHIFLYYETIDCVKTPDQLLPQSGSHLQDWPGEKALRKWIPLIDVFHFNAPAGLEHWKRKTPGKKHLGKVGILKPDRIPNYVFYHYALQEERAFGGDKYEIIGISENLLFLYMESPILEEAPVLEPQLHTHVVPENWADAGISPSFVPWPDRIGTEEERLRHMNEVLSVW